MFGDTRLHWQVIYARFSRIVRWDTPPVTPSGKLLAFPARMGSDVPRVENWVGSVHHAVQPVPGVPQARDNVRVLVQPLVHGRENHVDLAVPELALQTLQPLGRCLLYTSDAADE